MHNKHVNKDDVIVDEKTIEEVDRLPWADGDWRPWPDKRYEN